MSVIKLRWTKWMIILTPFVMALSIVSAGGGHGTQIPTLLCYPIMFLSRIFDSGGGLFVWMVLLGQFPTYGLVVDLGSRTSRELLAAALVALFHIMLVIFALGAR